MGSSGELERPRHPSRTPSGRRHLVLVGVNHRTASIQEREKLSRRVTYARLQRARGRATSWEDLVLLTTCNRIEAYILARDLRASVEAVRAAFEVDPSAPFVYVLQDSEAAAHLLRVASGLDSLAQGEGQVAGQVRRAPSARPAPSRKPTDLALLFERAAHLASRIHQAAGLSTQGTSASHAAIRFIETMIPVKRPRVTLLGSGKMAKIATAGLHGRATLSIVARNSVAGKNLARGEGASTAGLPTLRSSLRQTDVLIAATSSRRPLVTKPMVRDTLARRPARPLWIIDLGFPRNVSPLCALVPGAHLLDIDALAPWGARPLAPAALARAEARIREEGERLLASLQPDTGADVAAFRRALEEFRREEVSGAFARLPHLSEADRAVVDKLASRLLNRILHGPTERMRTLPPELRERLLSEFVGGLRETTGGRR